MPKPKRFFDCAQDENSAIMPGDFRSLPSTFLYICGKITADRVTVTLEKD